MRKPSLQFLQKPSAVDDAPETASRWLEQKHERRSEAQEHGSHSSSGRSWLPRVGAACTASVGHRHLQRLERQQTSHASRGERPLYADIANAHIGDQYRYLLT